MKRITSLVFCLAIFACCNNNNETAKGQKDPLEVQPVSDAIPDSLRLVNDSVLVPDLTPGNGSQTGRGDSAQKIQR